EVHAADAGGGAGRSVSGAVVGDAVRRDLDAGVGAGDAVGDGAAGVRVVAAGVVEAPAVVGVGAGVGVRGAGEVNEGGQVLAVHACGNAEGGVGLAVVGRGGAGVRRDLDAGDGLGDRQRLAVVIGGDKVAAVGVVVIDGVRRAGYAQRRC